MTRGYAFSGNAPITWGNAANASAAKASGNRSKTGTRVRNSGSAKGLPPAVIQGAQSPAAPSPATKVRRFMLDAPIAQFQVQPGTRLHGVSRVFRPTWLVSGPTIAK